MTRPTAEAVRNLILDRVSEPLAAKGLTPADVDGSFDLLLEGMIDSFGVVELISALEEEFDFQFDFDELEADDLTRLGPLSSYVEQKAAKQ